MATSIFFKMSKQDVKLNGKRLLTLDDRELPSLNPAELAFIDKWSAYLKHPFP